MRGSIRQRRPGVWEVRAYIGRSPQGRVLHASRTVRGGRRAAERTLTALLAEVDRGEHRSKARDTVAFLLPPWLEHVAATGRTPSTLETYRRHINTHILPALGSLRLTQVTPEHLDGFYRQRLAAGAAPRSVRLDHAILSSAFSDAVRWGRLATNPAARAVPPRIPDDEVTPPTLEEVRKLVVRAETDGLPELAVAVVLACVLGLRRGELCGLRWSDVDWDAGSLLVARQLQHHPGTDLVRAPKGHRRRTLALEEAMLAYLGRHRLVMEARAATLGVPMPEEAWLLSRDCGIRPCRPKWLGEAVGALGKRAGVPCHLHALRHFSATHLIAQGIDIRTAAGRLGHSPEVLLRTYAHQLSDRDRAAAGVLERYVLGAEGR